MLNLQGCELRASTRRDSSGARGCVGELTNPRYFLRDETGCEGVEEDGRIKGGGMTRRRDAVGKALVMLCAAVSYQFPD